MFTGIIQEIAKIKKVEFLQQKKYFTITCSKMQDDLVLGESIACNGICMTVIEYDKNSIKVEAMNQTLLTTTAAFWTNNTHLHLERALRLSDRLNGHIVQGHIDTVSIVTAKFFENNTFYLEVNLPFEYKNLITEHGSIAIDGVSLTVARLFENRFQVALIGHTIKETHFDSLKTGNKVNLEFDIIGKYVQNLLSKSKLTEDWLIKNGF